MLDRSFIRQSAAAAGFDLCGVAPCRHLVRNEQFFRRWLGDGRHASLGYLERNLDKRFDVRRLVEGAQTIVVCAVGYKNGLSDGYPDDFRAKIASYALTADYHATIKGMLGDLFGRLRAAEPALAGRAFVDSAPLVEKQLAVEAGLGWIGRQSLLVTPRFGSFVLLGELVLAPAGERGTFVPAYVDSEKKNLIDQIRAQLNDKLQYAMARLRGQMCQGEAYGLDKLGTEAQANAITGEALYTRYREMLAQAPVYLYYCGSADPARVEAAFRAAFAGLPNRERRPVPQTQVVNSPTGPVRRFQDAMDVGQGKLILGFRTGGSFRSQESIARGLLFNAIYGSTTTSKLFLHVREKLSLCYFANSSLAQNKGILQVYSGVEFANFQKAEEEILAQLAACQKGEISQEEWEAARRSVMGSLRTTLDAQGRLEEYWLNRFVSGTDFPPEVLAEEVDRVTLDQVVETAQKIQLDSIYTLRGKEG